jgi:hypothetical protein
MDTVRAGARRGMMKTQARRVLGSLVALSAVLTFAAGCSDDDDGDDVDVDVTSDVDVTEAPADTEAPATTGS